MEATGGTPAPIQLAKGALRRLAAAQLEPTPDNYLRAYREESGESRPDAAPADGRAVADGTALATLIERIARGIETGGKNWTVARKKDSLRRVLAGSRSDAARLLQRLSQLVGAWDSAATGDPLDAASPGVETAPAALDAAAAALDSAAAPVLRSATDRNGVDWKPGLLQLGASLVRALPQRDPQSPALAAQLADATRQLCDDGASPAAVARIESLCADADVVLQHHQRLFDQLGGLCQELTASLAELAENDSWARGQCDAMRRQFDEGLTSRGVRSVSALLAQTREHQVRLRVERDWARLALKQMVASMLTELAELGLQTGRFQEHAERYADVIEEADSMESLSDAVREMVTETRSVHTAVAQTRARLDAEHTRAGELAQVVDQLEGELRRLSDEVSTDQLTQVANRRGLLQAFEVEAARLADGAPLAIGLLDIDNFKRLNDELGHQAGDTALKALAAAVGQALRPGDKVARYGGEEFVVLLPKAAVDEGQTILTRLQRALSGGLFLHEAKPVLVTFSAGVTAYRPGERLEDAIERADRAMYEAKRAGKNRTCIA